MTSTPFVSRALAALACALTLSACTTTPTVPAKPDLRAMLNQAAQAAAAGQKEQAVKLWQQTAVAYPADKTPWASIAQTRYESGRYGDAIAAAEEVLVRDPNDKVANSIIAISGLRLSTRAIGELSRQNNLSGSLRTETQDLAKLLRESLNETVLVPVPSTQPKAPVVAERVKKAATNAKKAAKADESDANPFSALK